MFQQHGLSGNPPDYQISLNFMPLAQSLQPISVFRRKRTPQDRRVSDEIMGYMLPTDLESQEDWEPYWVSLDSNPGFDPFDVPAEQVPDLTCRVLFWSVKDAALRLLRPQQYRLPKSHFLREISFVQRTCAEGEEVLVVQPYFLRRSRQFGFLFDFHFHPHQGIPFSRRIQQLSLSLDREFRRNLDYYADRDAKMRQFIRERQDVLRSLRLPHTDRSVSVEDRFASLTADRLRSKTYVFAGNRESRSQFNGLRDHGPLKPLPEPPRLLFVFREQDRQSARILAQNLRFGLQHGRFTFPGFSALFKTDVEIDSNPVILSDLSVASIETALERVKADQQGLSKAVPILILPNEDSSYLTQKAVFSHAEIATQVCTLRTLQDENTLKWAIANLALQVFCKAGGYPWKVRPTADHSLIIGISQSHKTRLINDRIKVEKYFAFSVMTDSSGLFQKIQVLSEDEDQAGYLAKLRESLAGVLREGAQQFSRVVVHTSFKLKRTEIDAIHKTVVEAAGDPSLLSTRFAVVKVNQRSRFFGINPSVNSLVPYESTLVKLGPREYLVWFEGIFPDNPTVTKAFPGPTHLQILRVYDERAISDESLLQDLVNLSGANWRGFNAKSSPVSVFYCHLVADLVQEFHERGLPMPAIKDIRPWFL